MRKPYWPPLFVEIIRLDHLLDEMSTAAVVDFTQWKETKVKRRDCSMMAESVLHWNPTGRDGGPRAA